jgi:ABC-type multidrug transport system ATPase subunit
MNAIEARGLVRRFGRVTAVDGLDLDVPAERITGFLGQNGAGKTTTIRLLLGLLHPDAGEVRLLGETVSPGQVGPLRRVGALVEQPSLYGHLSGARNLEITCLYLGLPTTRARAALRQVGLEEAAGRAVAEYSLGMKQRLGLALALLGEPRLLILDEPANGLDPGGRQEMRETLRRLAAAEGVTIFLSSHLLEEVEQTASRVAVVHAGRLRFQGSVEDLRGLRQGRITVGVDDPARGREVLERAGWQVTPGPDGQLVLAGSGRDSRRHVAALLVEAGLGLDRLSEELPSLEEAFLEMVDERTGGSA